MTKSPKVTLAACEPEGFLSLDRVSLILAARLVNETHVQLNLAS